MTFTVLKDAPMLFQLQSSLPQRPALQNGHLSTTATFWADSPYIDSCLIFSTTLTFFCPQGGRYGEVELFSKYVAFTFLILLLLLIINYY